jgi:uncharacterized protein
VWASLTRRKLYITGGVGSDPDIEGFRGDYDLPDVHGYAETCAAIGLVFWAQRRSNALRDARCVDVLERALYNGVLSGASADGTHYFYGNPLASNGSVHRHEWFGVACCPPNLARLLSSLEYYLYSQSDTEAVVNLYVTGTARFTLPQGSLRVRVESDHPRHGRVRLTVLDADRDDTTTLALRIPGWCTGPSATLNGEPVPLDAAMEDGYLRINRPWKVGETIELDLPMAAHRAWAHPAVASAAGKVALERGPIVFCVEGVDHNVPVHTLALSRDAELDVAEDQNSGVVAVTAPASTTTGAGDTDAPLYRTESPAEEPTTLRAVPYFSWANRGQSDMTVWIRETD